MPGGQTTAGLYEGAEHFTRVLRMLEFVGITRLAKRSISLIGMVRQDHPVVGVRMP